MRYKRHCVKYVKSAISVNNIRRDLKIRANVILYDYKS